MADDWHEEDDELGEELDLELIQQEASKVQRRALEIDFDDVLPGGDKTSKKARKHGASSLEMDKFLSRKEREALERASGGTPTLKRLGKKAPRPAHAHIDGVLPMQGELVISTKGLPGWAWAVIAVAIIALVMGGGGLLLHVRYQAQTAEEAAALEAAHERVRKIEAERLRKLQHDD